MTNKLDIIAFGAHPDDVEISMGGTIISFVERGFKVGIVDLTQGELGSRGNKKIRAAEAKKASEVLGIQLRVNLKMPDGNLKVTKENIEKIVNVLRMYKPTIVFAPHFKDRHPDHEYAGQLVKEACFFAGLKNFGLNKKSITPYRPKKIFYFMLSYPFEPTFIYDISDYFDKKMEAIKSYSSQFFNPKSNENETFISRPEFLNFLRARSEFYGFLIGKYYGEPFYCEEKIEFDFSCYLK